MSKCKTEVAGPIEVKAMAIANRVRDAEGLHEVKFRIAQLAELFSRELDKLNAPKRSPFVDAMDEMLEGNKLANTPEEEA